MLRMFLSRNRGTEKNGIVKTTSDKMYRNQKFVKFVGVTLL